MFLVDSHCHLDLLPLGEQANSVADFLAEASKHEVKYCLNVCVNLASYPAVLRIAQCYPTVSASVGVHPNEVTTVVDLAEQLFTLAQQDQQVIAIGETGLDYTRLTTELDKIKQQERFRQHIRVAKQVNKPLIVHMRAATRDVLMILAEEKANTVGGILHCFTEDWETAALALKENFYISFSGIVTFRNAPDVQQVAKKVPLDRLLIETDAPYLAPHPKRGQSNQPAYLRYTAAHLAGLRHLPVEAIAQQTTTNFLTLFPMVKFPHV